MNRSFRQLLPRVMLALAALFVASCDGSPTGADEPIPEDCADAPSLPELGVGEGVRVQGGAAALLCPHELEDDAEYVLVVHNASGETADSTLLRIEPRGVEPPGSEPDPIAGAPGLEPSPLLAVPGPEPDVRRHLELRRLEREALAGRFRPDMAARAPGAAEMPARAVPEVGSFMDSLNANSEVACEDPILRTAEVMAVSDRAIVVADTLNPAGGFEQSDFARFAATFDTLVAPLAEEAFGTVSEFSGDDRTILFYTQEVNRLTARGQSSLVLGFFFARDLFPKDSCAASNEAEMLYLLVPDPDGEINGNEWDRDFVETRTLATMIHEYQHLINAGRRLHVIGTSNFQEKVWLNEGLSHLAEELLFYHTSGLEPGGNLGIDELRDGGQKVLDAINTHHLANINRLKWYLESPSGNSPYDPDALLPTRGAAWHFLRYAADRRGGSQTAFTRALVDGPATGIENLAAALGGTESLHEWLADWSVALYGDSRVPGLPARYRDLSWNHPSIYRALGAQKDPPELDYPLATVSLSGTGAHEQTMAGGGSAYFRFGMTAFGAGAIELTVEGRRPPEAIRTTLLRVR